MFSRAFCRVYLLCMLAWASSRDVPLDEDPVNARDHRDSLLIDIQELKTTLVTLRPSLWELPPQNIDSTGRCLKINRSHYNQSAIYALCLNYKAQEAQLRKHLKDLQRELKVVEGRIRSPDDPNTGESDFAPVDPVQGNGALDWMAWFGYRDTAEAFGNFVRETDWAFALILKSIPTLLVVYFLYRVTILMPKMIPVFRKWVAMGGEVCTVGCHVIKCGYGALDSPSRALTHAPSASPPADGMVPALLSPRSPLSPRNRSKRRLSRTRSRSPRRY